MKTDFASKGLDPNGSYIVVISGEDNGNSSNPNARGLSLPGQDIADDDGGAPTFFTYTYEGNTYWMRYVTVTPADTTMPLLQSFNFDVDRTENLSNWGWIFDAVINIATEHVFGDYASVVTFATTAFYMALGKPATVQNFTGFTIDGATSWTLQYIEVYDFQSETWYSAQRSEYAISTALPEVWIYNSDSQAPMHIEGSPLSFRTDSELYNNLESRKCIAAQCYEDRLPDYTDSTGDITFSVTDPFSGTQFLIEGSYEFTQENWMWSYHP